MPNQANKRQVGPEKERAFEMLMLFPKKKRALSTEMLIMLVMFIMFIMLIMFQQKMRALLAAVAAL